MACRFRALIFMFCWYCYIHDFESGECATVVYDISTCPLLAERAGQRPTRMIFVDLKLVLGASPGHSRQLVGGDVSSLRGSPLLILCASFLGVDYESQCRFSHLDSYILETIPHESLEKRV